MPFELLLPEASQQLSEADRLWIKTLAAELYGQPDDEIRSALKGRHPDRVVRAVCREVNGR